jgi:excisionase family DNA binding protein
MHGFSMEILTIDELAALLKLKRSSVYELTRERSRKRQDHPLPFIRVAGHLRFLKSDIEAWVDKLRDNGNSNG